MTATMQAVQDLYPTRLTEARPAVDRSHPTIASEDAAGPFTKDQLREHADRGFLILPEFLSATEIASYFDELERLENDPSVTDDERVVTEAGTGKVRSVFDFQHLSEALDALTRDPRILDRARQILGTDVYLHQTRINYQPGFRGSGFYWHSDFETWHAEDGMPSPFTVSCQIALTDNFAYNGGLMVMPGSHKTFVPCVGETPEDNFKSSLKAQKIGVPSEQAVAEMAARYGIEQFTGPAGTALWFDSNIMHGSGNNITPYPRSNIFMVFASVENTLVEPFAATGHRPQYIANRDFTPLTA